MREPLRDRDFEIVPMQPGDLDAVMEVERLAFRAPWSRQVFVEELERSWARVDLLRERRQGGRVVGFCNYWIVHDEIHVLNVAVHPGERRRGHATRLLRHLLDVARRRGTRVLTLEVRRSNLPAIGLYRRAGFRPVGIRAGYYVEDSEDAVVMLREE